jgi:hypothetical protein
MSADLFTAMPEPRQRSGVCFSPRERRRWVGSSGSAVAGTALAGSAWRQRPSSARLPVKDRFAWRIQPIEGTISVGLDNSCHSPADAWQHAVEAVGH